MLVTGQDQKVCDNDRDAVHVILWKMRTVHMYGCVKE